MRWYSRRLDSNFSNSQVTAARAPPALCTASMFRVLSSAALGVGVRRSAAPAAAVATTTHASNKRGRSSVASEDPGALDSTILVVRLLLAALAVISQHTRALQLFLGSCADASWAAGRAARCVTRAAGPGRPLQRRRLARAVHRWRRSRPAASRSLLRGALRRAVRAVADSGDATWTALRGWQSTHPSWQWRATAA
jgi:hypothetical protein